MQMAVETILGYGWHTVGIWSVQCWSMVGSYVSLWLAQRLETVGKRLGDCWGQCWLMVRTMYVS